MPKTAIKRSALARQHQQDALTGESLAERKLSLVDADRTTPKAEGGTYTDESNVRVLDPVVHMKRHGTHRVRESTLDEIKSVFDDRVQMMKLLLKENNQLLAYGRRTDVPHPDTITFLTEHLKPIEHRIAEIDKSLAQALKVYPDRLAQVALKVPGLGPVTVAALTSYVDLTKAATPSALWQYVGLDRPSHERYERNPEQQARRETRGPEYYGSKDAVPTGWGGNKVLRTVLWNTANVLMKLGDRSAYRIVYDRVKTRLAESEKIVTSRNTQGKLVEVAWKDAKPCHRHGAALRAIVKHLLADYWMVGRTVNGLPTVPLYAESMLGHTHIVNPRERGWEF